MSVYVAVPYTKPFSGAFVDSLLFMKKPADILWKRLPNMAVDVAREALCDWFLGEEKKPEYLLFIDNDATWHPLALERLLSHKMAMVCGAMYTRELPPTPTMGYYVGQTKSGKLIYKYSPIIRKILSIAKEHNLDDKLASNALVLEQWKPEQYLEEVDACGMHFTLIRRDVIEAVRKPRFVMGGRTGAGEDFYFCRKVKEAGFPIYTDLGVHTGHIVGEETDFGLRELLKMTKDVKLENITDDLGKWEVEGWL